MCDQNEKMISVVVPIYNVEKYLDRCIESVVSQDYKNLEIILVDDGSKDKSGAICDVWSQRDTRIRVIHKKNGGLADARNAGLDVARGSLITFIDSDDSIEAGTYRIMQEAMCRTDAGIVVCGKRKIYPAKIVETQNIANETIFSPEEALKELFIGNTIDESVCDKMFRAELFKNIRFPMGEINEDLPVIPILMLRSNRITHIGKSMYNYHQNEGSITRSGYGDKYHIVIKHIQEIRIFINKNIVTAIDWLWVLETRYSIAMLGRLMPDRKMCKKYSEDYQYYYNTLRRNAFQYIRVANCSMKAKMVIISMVTNMYPILYVIKQMVRK